MQQSRDLSSSLWRDFAIAVAALAARVAAGASAPIGPNVDLSIGLLLVFVCIFLIYSLWVTLESNHRFLAAARSSRETWTRKTYGFLQKAELDELASVPMMEVENVYTWTAWRVGFAYTTVVLVLLVVAALPFLGVHTNGSRERPSAFISPTSTAQASAVTNTGAAAPTTPRALSSRR